MCIGLMESDEFSRVWDIMQESFPVDEHRPFNQQKELLRKQEYKIYVLRNQNTVQGFIAVWELKSLLFIEHFAMDKACRNQGLGSKLLSYITNKYTQTICLEVEIPKDEITCRRVEFYKRNGFYLNPYEYMQPPLSAGQKDVPLRIMTYKREKTFEEFSSIRALLYKEVYRCDL